MVTTVDSKQRKSGDKKAKKTLIVELKMLYQSSQVQNTLLEQTLLYLVVNLNLYSLSPNH